MHVRPLVVINEKIWYTKESIDNLEVYDAIKRTYYLFNRTV